MNLHQSYKEILKRNADFRVQYRFYTSGEGGRYSPVFQGLRTDFRYENDGRLKNSDYIIWPEFEDANGFLIFDKSIPIAMTGTARMWVISKELIDYHRQYITVGTTGFFIEGSKKVAKCKVIELIHLKQ